MLRRLAAAAWVAVLAAVLVGLGRAGVGALAPPPLSPGAWAAWAATRTPVEAAAAVLRLVVLAGALYLLAVTVVGVAAGLLRRRRAVVAVARWSPPVVRWLLGAWLAGALAVGPAAAAPDRPPPTMVLLPDERPTTTTTTGVPVPAPPAAPAVPAEATTTLAPGDHLWSVAARTLAAAWGRPPAEREVAPYWRLVVERNRAELPNPDDPDLVFPGEVVRLPPLPG
jgi:hypothetical protein